MPTLELTDEDAHTLREIVRRHGEHCRSLRQEAGEMLRPRDYRPQNGGVMRQAKREAELCRKVLDSLPPF